MVSVAQGAARVGEAAAYSAVQFLRFGFPNDLGLGRKGTDVSPRCVLSGLLLAILICVVCGCGESEEAKACKDAQWAAKAAWAESERELRELRTWLREYDVWHLQSRNPDARIAEMKKSRDKKWKMWVAAAEASQLADEGAWDAPSKAVFTARQGVRSCDQAASSSPPVQKRGGADASEDEPEDVMVLDWYTPGRRALKTCRDAGQVSEAAWAACESEEPTSEEEKALEEKTYSFF